MNNRNPININARRQSGVTVVEFALVIPFALLLVLGVIQLGLMFSAREILDQAAFQAARAGSFQNARLDKMNDALNKALIPFYQNTGNGDDFTRLSLALQSARADARFITVERLNPTADAFTDFGVTSAALGNQVYIPNDNLEYRSHAAKPVSGLSIQDANALKIKVTYGYELKVPLVKAVIQAVMCGFNSGLDAFGKDPVTARATGNDCSNYYLQGRIPIVAYATVQMQTPAWRDN